MSIAYEPSRSLPAKISRRVTPFLSRRVVPVNLEQPIISFTFDDCPASAIENGVKVLEAKGYYSTIYVSGSLLGQTNHHGVQITEDDVKALHAAGHEIGGHSFSHIDAQSVTLDGFLADIEKNTSFLSHLGLPPCPTFAYPYGQTHAGLKKALEGQFIGMRGIQPGVHRRSVDLNQICSVPLFGGERIEKARRIIRSLQGTPAWVTFFTHDIREKHSNWGCSPKDYKSLVEEAEKVNALILPVDRAVARLGGSHDG